MWQAAKVFPWVGPNYDFPKVLPYKTLVLGESNYTEKTLFNSNLVVNCVKCHLTENDDPNFSRFATKLLRVIFPKDSVVSASDFWNDIAFYNFIQYLVGGKARERPSKLMWNESAEAFEEVVQKLNPERILVLGKANWANLLHTIEHETLDQYKAQLFVGDKTVLAGYTKHPSSSLAYAVWRPVVEGLLAASK